MELPDGAHRHPTLGKLNLPEMRNCFACMRDKMCTIVEVPEGSLRLLREKHGNLDPLLLSVINQYATKQYTCCEDCKQNKAEKFFDALVEYILAQYELAKIRRKRK